MMAMIMTMMMMTITMIVTTMMIHLYGTFSAILKIDKTDQTLATQVIKRYIQ